VKKSLRVLAKTSQLPKIPKGFIMVNLSEQKKRELRDLALETGWELRGVLRIAVMNMYRELKEAARVQRITGWTYPQQCQNFRYKAHSN